MHVCVGVFQRYSEAEEAMEQVLKLDPHCKEAPSELLTCRVQQLVVNGFSLNSGFRVKSTSSFQLFTLFIYLLILGVGFCGRAE